MRMRMIAAAAAVATAAVMSGCSGSGGSNPILDAALDHLDRVPGLSSITDDDASDSLDALYRLPIVVKVDDHSYNRLAHFGPAWTDDNDADPGKTSRNGCSTRNDILDRDMRKVRKQGQCKVISGVLDDPYTGREIEFRYGKDTSAAVQIDHIVSLKDAWLSGARDLDQSTRVNIANDPLNLIASDGPQNMSKSDKDASRWLVPDNPDYRCEYAQRQVQVKTRYRLGVSAEEYQALADQLRQC